jgi:hypothetical protein
MRADEVLREPGEGLRSVELDRPDVLANSPIEFLADRDHGVPEFLDADARRLVLVHAREAEVPEDLVDREPGVRILFRNIEGDERVVERPVQREVRREPFGFLVPLVRGLADGRIGMHVEQELRLALQLREVEQHAVVGHEEIAHGPGTTAGNESLQPTPEPGEARGRLLREGIRVQREQEPRGGERSRPRSRTSRAARLMTGWHGSMESSAT